MSLKALASYLSGSRPQLQDDAYITINVPDSSGGMNTRQHETEINDNQLTIGYNIDLSTIGKKKKRLGRKQVLNDLGSNPIVTLAYLAAPSVAERMCCIHNLRIYKSTDASAESGNWVDIDSTDRFTADTYNTATVVAGDELFISNGVNNVFSYDGTGVSDEGSATTDPPKGQSLAYFQNRLWVARTTTNPDYVYYSNSLDAHTFVQSTQLFKVSTGDTQEVTNMIPYNSNTLIIFKERSIHELLIQGSTAAYWNLRMVDDKNGCVALDCAKTHNGIIYYLSHDGIRTYPAQPKPISYYHKDLFDSINWQYINRARMIIFQDKLYISLPVSSGTYATSVGVLDLNTGSWVTYTGWNVGCWGIHISQNNVQTLMYGEASADGKVYKLFKSTQYNDDSTAITYQEETKAYDFGYPFNYKSGGEVWLDIASDTSNTATAYAAIDGGSYAELGISTSGCKFPLEALGKWKSIKFKMLHNATSTAQLIYNGFRVATFLEAYF